jgi:hypothetical protein
LSNQELNFQRVEMALGTRMYTLSGHESLNLPLVCKLVISSASTPVKQNIPFLSILL